MSRGFKEETKFHDVTGNDLAKELGISEDRIAAIQNNLESTPVGRLVDCYDYMGGDPTGIINELSDNRFAHDSLEQVGNELRSTKEKIASVISMYNNSSDRYQGIINAVDTIYKYPLIYISGELSSGKLSMAENLIGEKFRSLGSPLTRSYTHLLIMSNQRSGIEYNYPFGEYPYRIESAELIPELLRGSIVQNMDMSGLTPIAKEGMDLSGKNYVVYSDSPALSTIDMVCSEQLNTMPDNPSDISSTETDTQIIGLADVIIIMLSEGAGFRSKLIYLLRCGWELWGYDMTEHIIFVIPKSDRFTVDEISSMKQSYAEMLTALLDHIITSDDKRRQKLIEDVSDMIFPYSSIYKIANEKHKNDASYNWSFYQRLHQILASVSDDAKRRECLYEALRAMKKCLLPENVLSNESAGKIRMEIRRITADAENDFNRTFSMEYDELINIERISEIITQNGITRKQEDRNRFVNIVNSKLTELVRYTAAQAIIGMVHEFLSIDISMINMVVLDNILTSIKIMHSNICGSEGQFVSLQEAAATIRSLSNSDIDGKKNIIDKPGVLLGTGLGAVVSMGLFPVSGIITGAASIAGAAVSSYYAQTNFDKNMAKKLVSSYNAQHVKESLSDKMIQRYFKPLREELFNIVNNSSLKGDAKIVELIDKILEVVTDY